MTLPDQARTGPDFIRLCEQRRQQLRGKVQTPTAMSGTGLPRLPEGWVWSSLSSVCERVSVGHVGPTTEFFSSADDSIALIRSQDVRPGRLEAENCARITPHFHASLRKSQLKGGDILVVRVGANRGDSCVVPDGLGKLNCANIIFARPLCAGRFFGFFTRSDFGQHLLLSATTGAAQGVINTQSVAALPVPVPPLAVQERIASMLSSYDDLIENNRRRTAILEEMARRIYEEWFVRFRFPSHEGVRMVESELGLVPEGWRPCVLGDILENVRVASRAGDHLSSRRYVPIDCIGRKTLALAEFKPWTDAQSSLVLFEVDDVLFGAMRAYFHKVCIAPFPGVTRTTCFVLRPRKSEFTAFGTMTAFAESTVDYAAKHAQGATIPYAVWDGSLARMPILRPPDNLLRQFEIVVAPMLAWVKGALARQNNLRETRDLLLPRLISGELDVSAMPEPEALPA